jgi:hypothetical protein
MTEALECLERARGHLYSFHQLMGRTDLKLDEVVNHSRCIGVRPSPGTQPRTRRSDAC